MRGHTLSGMRTAEPVPEARYFSTSERLVITRLWLFSVTETYLLGHSTKMKQEQSSRVAPAVAPGLSRNLAERALALHARGVPPEILAATKRAIMNALGAAALGSHRSAMTAAIGYAADQSVGISGGPLIPLHPNRLSVADAAFITGAMIHLEDFDDSYLSARIH